MLTPEISQTDRQGRSIFKVAPWLARCYPSGQIPRSHRVLRGCPRHLIADRIRTANFNRSLDTITGKVATLTTRPPRRRWIAAFGALLKWPSRRKGMKEKFWRNPDPNPWTLDRDADTLTTQPRYFVETPFRCRSQEQNLVPSKVLLNLVVTHLQQFHKV